MDSNLFSRSERIVEVDQLYKDTPSWSDFFTRNDLGIPYAYLVIGRHGTLNDEGTAIVNATWLDLCNFIGVDYEAEYDSIETMEILGGIDDES